jgi:tetratricopeptide (TPR) repeat protein
VTRLVRAAEGDLRRGETARAAATLRSVVELDPTRAEAHWYLALLDRSRGRYDAAERHLRSFLAYADGDLASQRASAERRLRALDDERRLADSRSARGELELVAQESPHFRIRVDSALDRVSAGYAATALRYLEDARRDVSGQLGVEPDEPLGVVFYGRARYDQEHQHRFSFSTVGFFDGRIHVASPAHPTGELRALLFHEYTHALFREQTGGDRPYWLNEGLAERIERRSRGVPASTHSERAALRTRIATSSWIPLRSLARSFSGLGNEDARIAYLESVVAADWIESRTTPAERARLLSRLGGGFSIDQALHEAVGLDTDGVDRAVRDEIRAEFPELVGLESKPPAHGDDE